MKRAAVIVGVLLIVLSVAGGLWWTTNRFPGWWLPLEGAYQRVLVELGLGAKPAAAGLSASGFIEADEAVVSSEQGGRITVMYADEGDEVQVGQVLVELDDSILLGQIQIAEADVTLAEATLAQVKAGVPSARLATARAELDQAVQAQEASRVAWEDAQAMRDNPQELDLSIAAAKAQLGVLDFQSQQAQAMANAAQAGRDYADAAMEILEGFEPYDQWVEVGTYKIPEIPPELGIPTDLADGEYRFGEYRVVVSGNRVRVSVLVTVKLPRTALDDARYQQAMATYQSWTAWTGLDQADAARSGAQSYLAQLNAQAANPLTLQAQVDAAEGQYKIAVANVALAQAQVTGLEMGATAEQISAAESQVTVARAGLEALRVQLDRFTLTAPISGLALERPVQVGEMAAPGAPLMRLADLDELTLTVYVPENQLGLIRLGQPVSVTVDAYPGRTFMGAVKYIATQAEFTPKNVQTKEQRVSMVFAVQVRLANRDHALKPGMPADAVILEPGKSE
jgi:HlyD family secretion protein